MSLIMSKVLSLKAAFAVFGMGTDPGNTHDAGLIADNGDDPVVIAFDIKDHAISREEVGGSVAVFDVLWRGPAGSLNLTYPSGQRMPNIGVFAHKIVEKIAAEQGHDTVE
jgi:hypothetical protein